MFVFFISHTQLININNTDTQTPLPAPPFPTISSAIAWLVAPTVPHDTFQYLHFVHVYFCALPHHRLLLMFAVSAGVAVCNYFISSTLGVVLFSTATGFLLSLDLSQVGALCNAPKAHCKDYGPRRGRSPPPPLSNTFGWNLGCREVVMYACLLLAALAEAGLLHHFHSSAQSHSLVRGPQAPVSYLLLVLFSLCWLLGEIQGAYVCAGLFLNPVYPKGMSSVQTFEQKNRGLFIAAAIRRVLLYLGEIMSLASIVLQSKARELLTRFYV